MGNLYSLIFIVFCVFTSLQSYGYEDVMQVRDQHGDSLVYIEGLTSDLFRKYSINDSRGPSWGQDIDYLSGLMNKSFYERSTYWSETGYPRQECPHFSDADFENTSDVVFYDFKWESVKRVEGSTRTVFYLASYELELNVEGSSKSCTYIPNGSQKYVFLNRLDEDGNPVYLGELLHLPPN